MIETLRELYFGRTARAHRFRTGILLFDLATLIFIVASSFGSHGPVVEATATVFGVAITLEVLARMIASRNRRREVLRFSFWADLIAIASFIAPVTGEAAGFLRVLRTLGILRAFLKSNALRGRAGPLHRHEETIIAAANLAVFIFVMTALVYETQYRTNPDIGNYADALYFTVTALTTTGFGDITLPGTAGRMISVLIMIFGVTLFLRLAQVLFRPPKVRHPCRTCGLQRHDPDAMHCKACGSPLNIPDEGWD